MSTRDKLNSVFCEVFNNPDIQITPQTTANDIDGWDSLSHINLIVAVETTFGVSFVQKELMRLRSVGDLINLIDSKISISPR
jgi:acyl carrier protein